LQTGALEFDASTFEIWGTLLNGLTLFIALRDDILSPGKLKENINKNDIAIMWLTSSLFNRLCGLDVEIFAGLRYLLAGGDVLAPAYINRVRRRFPHLRIINGYGPTENTTFSTSFEIDGEYRESIPIGKPIAHSSVYIVDKFTNTQPIGAAGELCVGGDGVARGYLNNPELTAEKFELLIMLLKNKSFFGGGRGAAFSKKAPLVYRTGDLARWLPDGNIEFLGRIDQQVKIRGFRVEPGEIEYPLLQHPDIKDAVVVSRQEKGGAIYLCAYMVPIKKDDNQLSVSKLREFLAGKLPPYMIPQYFVQLDGIPLTVNGKIDKRLLPEPDISNIKPDSVYSAPADDMEQLIAGVWQEVLKIDQIGIHDNFFDLGGNSLKIIQVNNKLNEALHIKIPVVTFFQYPTISGLKNFLQNEGWVENKNENTEIQPVSNVDGFAVIGMAGRFPGASNINEYWENIKNGIESISFFNNEELAAQGVPAAMLENPAYVKAKGISSDKDRFDAAFFHYTPQEARIMDPQMRIFHECVWEACEDAGYNPEVYDKPIGLYAGAAYNSGWEAKVKLFAGEDSMSTLEAFQLVNSHFIPTRVSYKLNLKGPAMFVQSGCSTSLNAIHTALNALAAGDCAMALAGGVSLSHDKKAGYLYQEGMILSPDGHCRAFDANAGGTVGGEGAAVVLLKPFAQAAADGDHIYAVVKASAANNDGARKVGFSAPSVEGQGESIAIAFAKAGFPPESITYIETHGTGTTLGDPIELAALKMAFKTSRKGFCALGSVKTNVGHMDSASGAVGFIKTVLALKYKQIPPSLFFETPNLHADLINSPFYINTGLSTWQPGSFPRRAGVSSFGIGGTNVHVVLEEYDYVPNSEGNGYKMLLLSAQSEAALAKMKENLRHFLIVNHDLNLDDIAYTLQVGRKFFSRRWVTICSGREGAIAALASPGIILEGTGETLKQTAQLWLQGQEIAGKKSSAGQTLETPGKPGAPDTHEKRNRVPLPTYPFEVDGRRYWIDGNPFDFKDITETMRDHGEIRKKDIADWFYIPRWLQ
jgi:3-oxoacyl-(acyl-carrier-protein) synthase/acyl carrier protein